MTQIRLVEDDGRYQLTAEGHAAYGEKGKDIVCAGVSTLICTLNACLTYADEQGKLRFFESELRDGAAIITWEPEEGYRCRIGNAVDTILTGLELMAENYPQNVEVRA